MTTPGMLGDGTRNVLFLTTRFPAWGRYSGHDVAHFWRPSGPEAVHAHCFTVVARRTDEIDVTPSARYCERCTARIRAAQNVRAAHSEAVAS